MRFGGSRRGREIPFADYALTFVLGMPQDLREFIEAGLPQSDERDDDRATRVAELFGNRFGAVRFAVDDEGDAMIDPIFGGSGDGEGGESRDKWFPEINEIKIGLKANPFKVVLL